jgi:hypothetical protein
MNEEWEKKMLDECGWYMDAIYAEEFDEIHANYHTHGIQENLNHMDFQLVFNLPPEVVNDIFFTLVADIRSGIKFEVNKVYSDILEGHNVAFAQYIEMGRDVLRVLLPDENGKLPTEDDCDEYYKLQLEDYDFDSEN